MNSIRNDSGVQLPETIHRPDLQNGVHRSLFAIVSTMGWLVWLYLFAPLFSVLAWAFGYQRFNDYVLDNPDHALMTLVVYAAIIAGAGVIFVLWAVYNLMRFRGKSRRTSVLPMSMADMAKAHGMPEPLLRTMQQARVQCVHHDEHGQIIAVDVLPLEPSTATADATPGP